jgi:protein-disulfide isomerase
MAKKREVLETASSVAVLIVALVMTAVYFHDRQKFAVASAPPPMFVENWEEANRTGIWIGSRDADVVLTEFMDFTCPFCRNLVPVVDTLLHRYPNNLAVVFQHFPLGRALSLPSAIAAECAGRQGAFVEMYRRIYRDLESLLQSSDNPDWTAIAIELELSDIDAFKLCVSLPADSFPRIAAGRELGQRTGVTGTPTVWINGHRTGARNVDQFVDAIERIITAK